MVLDEPELGLHPYAINVIGGLIGAASHNTQVILATQSALLVDGFEPEDIVVVERQDRAATFTHLDSNARSGWLNDYSIFELREKMFWGGRP